MLRLSRRVTIRAGAAEVRALRDRIITGSPADANGCWRWSASVSNGYGQISVHDTNVRTHKLSYQLFVGEIPIGRCVLHACDDGRCNNPAHLFVGTQLANVRDMWRKGRAIAPPIIRGEAHALATLSDRQVSEIIRRVASGDRQRDVAADFGCSQSTVWRIAHGIVRSHRSRKAS